jgi:hypothetical protein
MILQLMNEFKLEMYVDTDFAGMWYKECAHLYGTMFFLVHKI